MGKGSGRRPEDTRHSRGFDAEYDRIFGKPAPDEPGDVDPKNMHPTEREYMRIERVAEDA